MKKRVTLTDEDIELLIKVLEYTNNTVNGAPYLAATQRKDQLLKKLKTTPKG